MKKLKLNEWVPMDGKGHLVAIIENLEQIFWDTAFSQIDIAVQTLDDSQQYSLLVRQATAPMSKKEAISIICAEDFDESPPALSLSLRFVTPDDGGVDNLALFWETESRDPAGDPAHNVRFLFTAHPAETGFSILIQDWIDLVDYWAERWTHITVHA